MQWGLSPALGCANDACSIRLPRKTRVMALLLLFLLPCLSKNSQSSGIPSKWSEVPYRLEGVVIGYLSCPPAAYGVYRHKNSADRHNKLPAGRKSLQQTD